ncbi:hypothetical protein SAMD00019534_004370, partial [Acytostelium subglobosum LB1]|uniref:hypothetical protein n=1 Tax=Acytostelium subglobosum LB1 TaxID=1410327 RepID=UPI000644B24E
DYVMSLYSSRHSHASSSSSHSSFHRLFKFTKSFEKGAFSVIYAMTKGNTFPKILTIISTIIEFIQLASFGFKPSFPWGGQAGYWIPRIVSPFSHPSNLFNYYGYQVLYLIVVSFMLLGFLNMIYVGYKFYQGKIANIYTIRTLRWFVSFTVNVLYIPILSLFLISVNCEHVPSLGYSVLAKYVSTGELIQCFGGTNLPYAIVSIVLIVIFSLISFLSQLTYYEYDTTCKTRFAKPHARFDMSILLVKTILSLFFTLLSEYRWVLCITYFLGMTWLVFGSTFMLPLNNQRLNQVRDIDRANLFYQCGLQYFPRSTLVWMAYTNYLISIRKDRHIGYASLEKLRSLSPRMIDIRFFLYQRDREREQMMDSELRGPHAGKIEDFVSYMEFKKLYSGARRYHSQCLTYIGRFWKILSYETIDLSRLSALSGRIASRESLATEQYERLLSLNPSSVRVLRDYSQFIEDVVKDRYLAAKLAKKADRIEESMSKSLSLEHEGGASSNNIHAQLDEHKDKGGFSSGDDTSESSGSSGRKSSRRYQEYQQSNSITKLSWLMFFTSLLSLAFLIACLVVMRNQTYDQKMYAFARMNNLDGFEQMRNSTKGYVNSLENIHRAIYWGETQPYSFVGPIFSDLLKQKGYHVYDISSRVFDYKEFNKTRPVDTSSKELNTLYNTPSFTLNFYVTINSSNIPMKYNGWKAGNQFVGSGLEVLESEMPDWIVPGFQNSTHYQFVVSNGPQLMTQAYFDIQLAYITKNQNEALNNVFLILILWGSIFVLFVLVAALLLRTVVVRITRETLRTMMLFTLAPRSLVQMMCQREYKLSNLESSSDRDLDFYNENEEEEEEEPVADEEVDRPADGEKEHQQLRQRNVKEKQVDEEKQSLLQQNNEDESTALEKRNVNKKSLRSVHMKLHYSYIFALTILFAIITMSLFVSFSETLKDIGAGNELTDSAQRSGSADISIFYAFTYATSKNPLHAQYLINATNTMQRLHQSLQTMPQTRTLMEGGYGCYMIDQSRCRTPEDPYYFDVSLGLDWTINQFVQNAMEIAHVTNVSNLSPMMEPLQWISQVGSNEVFDGMKIATYLFYNHWQTIQDASVRNLTIGYAVGLVAIVLVYFLLFRPFISRLRVQHTHTLALLRLAPKEIQMIDLDDKVIY